MVKEIKKVKKIIKNNWPIIFVIGISLIMHSLALNELGFKYSLKSDDLHYVYSGIEFAKTGHIIMHDVLSAQIMPGLTFVIAFLSLIFGSGIKLWIALKILYMLMGLMTIVIVYKTLRLYTNKYIATIPCIFFLAADFVWMDNLILTETPFILLFSLLVYFTLRLSINRSKRDYILIIICYILALFIRPNIGIYPLFLFIFLLLKKYDLRLLIKQCLVAGIVLLLVLTPWTIRNYKVFGKFIPLTYGMGNPLLLGTYQGFNYPADDEVEYQKEVYEKAPEELRYYLENPDEKDYMTKYYSLEYDGLIAKYRMRKWWKNDKKAMLRSYLLYKPRILIDTAFYWKEILGIKISMLYIIRKVELILTAISILVIIINKKRIKEMLFLGMIYMSQIILYAYTFAFDRYGITLFFIRYLIIGIGIDVIYKMIKNRSKKNESINDSSSI